MSYLAIPLSLAAGGTLASIVVMLARDSRTEPTPAAVDRSAPAATMPAVIGTHAAPQGRARVTIPSLVIDPPTSRRYVGRHYEDTVDIAGPGYQAPLYSAGFAAVVGYDRPDRRQGREAAR